MEDSNREIKTHLNRLMKGLARRGKSTHQVREGLSERKVDIQICEKIIEKLITYDFLNDYRFAREFVISSMNNGRGPHRMRADLARKGVERSLVEKAIETEEVDRLENKIIKEALEKRFRTKCYPSSARELKNLLSFLTRRGFSGELIKKNTEKLFEEVFDSESGSIVQAGDRG